MEENYLYRRQHRKKTERRRTAKLVFDVSEEFKRRKLMWRYCGIILLGLLLAVPDLLPRDRHFSFWSDNPQPFLDAIQNSAGQTLPKLPSGQRVCGGILTQHFLASGLMVRFFAELQANSSPETIILLGPNHFHQGLANISISLLPWKTPFGVLQTDRQLVQAISEVIQ